MIVSHKDWFPAARYGLFIHFGLYSTMGRGEWGMNREELSGEEMNALACAFDPIDFKADEIAELAVAGGMKYIVFTTMHHEGFRLYHSELSDFCMTKTRPQRDLVEEIIAASRKRGLRVGLYHSLNNWYDQPDAVSALEDDVAYREFMARTFSRLRELVTRYNPVDLLWYDGWWPFDAKGWRAEEMNAMIREIQPHILFNGRNGLPGDFATPEQHLGAPKPWRPWEACVTLNDNWGFHAGDRNWKTPLDLIKMLARVAQGGGNLLLNIGPRGDGCIPVESSDVIRKVGQWLKANGECIFGTDRFTFDLRERGDHPGDWCHHGTFTAKGHVLYLVGTSLPVGQLVLTGLEMKVTNVTCLASGRALPFRQENSRLAVDLGSIPERNPNWPAVIRMECDRPPSLYKTGGMRLPHVIHPRYDPLPSDIS